MKTSISSRRAQSGSTYMTVVITTIIVGAMLAAYLKMISVQNQFTMRSQAWNRSVPVLEAGVEEAMAHLNRNASPDASGNFNVNLVSDGWAVDPNGGWFKVGNIGDDYYHTRITSFTPGGTGGNFPFIESVGYVKQLPTFSLNRGTGPFLAAISLQDLTSAGYTKRAVLAGTTNVPTFTKALVARRGIDMNGNGVFVDSFDSSNTNFSTNKRWVWSKHRANGDIASNDTITNTISIQNANIWGRVATGPHGTVSIGSQGCVGDAAWQANSANRGKIQPGYSTDDMNVQFPEVVLPAGSGSWSAPSGGGGYSMVLDTPNGNYRVWSGNVNGKILVNAPNVRLRVDSGWNFNGQDFLEIRTNASIKIYLNCPTADITGQGIVNSSGTANQCYIFATSALRTLDMGGNGETTCVLYAPYTDVTFHGGGSSDQDFSGAAIVNSIRLTGHYSFHYDEALGRIGLYRGYSLTSWNEN